MKEKYYPPKYYGDDFHCPNCGVYSHQYWSKTYYQDSTGFGKIPDTDISTCSHCHRSSFWHLEKLIYPSIGSVPLPNADLPPEILEDYDEAREIINQSPRGASALLRLAIQKLCMHLGQSGKNINSDIAALVKIGLPVKIQQALDYVRVIGNNSVHPGQIDLKDNFEIAQNLFDLINIIAEVMITQPKEIEKLYNTLPDEQKKAINKRDNKDSL
jgi:hypothetical protein